MRGGDLRINSELSLLDMVIVATGILHEGKMKPEKSIKDLSLEKFQRIFEINSIVPILIAKHLLPKISAGVGYSDQNIPCGCPGLSF